MKTTTIGITERQTLKLSDALKELQNNKRDAFADEITKLAQIPEIVLSGDIGNRMFDKFKQGVRNAFITVVSPSQT